MNGVIRWANTRYDKLRMCTHSVTSRKQQQWAPFSGQPHLGIMKRVLVHLYHILRTPQTGSIERLTGWLCGHAGDRWAAGRNWRWQWRWNQIYECHFYKIHYNIYWRRKREKYIIEDELPCSYNVQRMLNAYASYMHNKCHCSHRNNGAWISPWLCRGCRADLERL